MHTSSHSNLVRPYAATPVMQDSLGWGAPDHAGEERTDLDPRQPVGTTDGDMTTVRPPLPALLAASAAQVAHDGSHDQEPDRPSIRGFAASLRGQVGKYQLVSKLGRGAFGVVFTARDPSLDRDVAIKVLRPSHLTNLEIVQRFLQEARATARINHPGIVMIHDCGRVETTAGTTAYIAMELLSGESLTARLTRTVRFAPVAAIEIIRQVASALEAAHRADVLHRDLKPDNIYLVPDPAMPEGERIKVLDFGLAKLGEGGAHTAAQLVFGTPRYMSPEQCRSAAAVDHRSDIYALGCILFELVTGRSPFEGDLRTLIECHQRSTAPRASSLAPDVRPGLDELIADMLAKDPMSRPQTMGAVQRALAAAVEEAAPVAPETGMLPRPSAKSIPRPMTGGGMPPSPGPFVDPISELAALDALASLDALDAHAVDSNRSLVEPRPPPTGLDAVSGVLLVPAVDGGAPAPVAPLASLSWHRILLGALCLAIGAAGGAIAWLSLR